MPVDPAMPRWHRCADSDAEWDGRHAELERRAGAAVDWRRPAAEVVERPHVPGVEAQRRRRGGRVEIRPRDRIPDADVVPDREPERAVALLEELGPQRRRA